MKENKRKTVSLSMIIYELRNVTGNPFVHIFGIGLPIFFLFIITRIVVSNLQDTSLIKTASTSVFLGISTIIPMAMIHTADIFEKHIPFVRRTRVILTYGEPIYVKELDKEQKKHLGSYVQGIIREMLEEELNRNQASA